MESKKTAVKSATTRSRTKDGKTIVSRPRAAQNAKKRPIPARKVPLEDVECENFVKWLCRNKIPHTHIPNESRSSKRDAAIRARKLKKMGVSRGVWDYEIFIPIYDIDGVLSYQQLKIEMKRQRGGGSTVSPQQTEWGKIYALAGIPCKICYGAAEAVAFVKEYMPNEVIAF